MAVDGVGNGPPFSKARWARPRVHGADTAHGLFGCGGRPLERVGALRPSGRRSSLTAMVDRGAS